jgi:subtilisin family serine protease
VFIEPFDPTDSVDVVVIDSGYIQHPVLHARGGLASTQGHYLAADGRWTPEPPDGLDLSPTDGLVDAIAGHGTFIAGVVATGCSRARMTIVGHRHIDLTATTELAVARSICASATIGSTQTRTSGLVIACGYAFATQGCLPSVAFEAALSYLTSVDRDAVLVSPAGNEAVDAPQWPAAFRSVGYTNVVGVGSLARCGTKIADFSNRGDWVDCFAIGEDVVSTHITTRHPMATEERPQVRQLFTGWSEWSGTSFAAPKVAAAIAARAGDGITPREAAAELLTAAPRMPNGGDNGGTAANLAALR